MRKCAFNTISLSFVLDTMPKCNTKNRVSWEKGNNKIPVVQHKLQYQIGWDSPTNKKMPDSHDLFLLCLQFDCRYTLFVAFIISTCENGQKYPCHFSLLNNWYSLIRFVRSVCLSIWNWRGYFDNHCSLSLSLSLPIWCCLFLIVDFIQLLSASTKVNSISHKPNLCRSRLSLYVLVSHIQFLCVCLLTFFSLAALAWYGTPAHF